LPVVISHRRTTPSSLPDAKNLLFEWNTTLQKLLSGKVIVFIYSPVFELNTSILNPLAIAISSPL
jgi:hypothetical protein